MGTYFQPHFSVICNKYSACHAKNSVFVHFLPKVFGKMLVGRGGIQQGCISCGTCSYPELTEDDVLTSAYVKIFRIVTRNAVNKSV